MLHLKLDARFAEEGTDYIEVEWLHLLRQFSTMQTRHVSHELAWHVAVALDIAWETVAETLPSLDLVYLADQPASSIEKFVTARLLSGRPVTDIVKEVEFNERLRNYVSE